QIQAPAAHAITSGSSVLVGDLDTGLDYTHPDLAANVDFANSVSCESGAPDQTPAAWADHQGHGTHTAGTIAAASNGIGIVRPAPPTQTAPTPANPTPVLRPIHNDCAVIPVEVPGVIGVSADGNRLFKSYYSNYGIGTIQVIAPGGDRRFQQTADSGHGRVLSTMDPNTTLGHAALLAGVGFTH